MENFAEERTVVIPSSRGDIHSVFTGGSGTVRDRKGDRPLVIMCHGLMMHGGLNPISGISSSFAENGYDTLRMDFRGSGKSGGDIMDMTPLTEVDDLLAVMRYVAAEPAMSADGVLRRFVICGHSLGGLVSLFAASVLYGSGLHADVGESEKEMLRGALAGLILLAPAVNIEEDSRAGRVAYETFDPVDIPESVEVWGSKLSRNYFLTARSLDTFSTISHYRGPACILMGERDRIVEMDLSGRLLAALPQAEMHMIKHGDHLFSRVSRLRATEIALGFLGTV